MSAPSDRDELACDLLLEEGPLLCVNKPATVLTQAPPGIDSVELRVKRYLKRRDRLRGKVYLGVCHRLDRPVTGVLLFTTTKPAARRVSRQFERRSVEKIYWAMVGGIVEPSYGTWRDHMRKAGKASFAEIASPAETGQGEVTTGVREARLRYRTLLSFDDRTLLEIQLDTGRFHQIRLQAGVRGHVILGDFAYGSEIDPWTGGAEAKDSDPATRDKREMRIALHARRLAFTHPDTNERITITAAAPPHWRRLDLPDEAFRSHIKRSSP